MTDKDVAGTIKPRSPASLTFAGLLTLSLLCLCTWALLALERGIGDQRPYTILYLVPVALGAALRGVRGGIATGFAALILARVYLFNDQKHGIALLSSVPLPELIEFLALFVGALTVAYVTGRLRSTLGQVARVNTRLAGTNADLEQANARLRDSERQRREFSHDVLLAVTGGKLRLIEPDEMPPPDLVTGPPTLTLPLIHPGDASHLRHELKRSAEEIGMDPERLADLCTSTTEAATNAIKHGDGGEARVWIRTDTIAVLVQDHGCGIAPAHLARATLEQGYSSKISLGMGYFLMLQMADVVALATGATGTALLLEVSTQPRLSERDSLLARYASLSA